MSDDRCLSSLVFFLYTYFFCSPFPVIFYYFPVFLTNDAATLY